MKHEAVAVDSRTGYVYLTEDNGPSPASTVSGRVTRGAASARSKAWARYEMLKVKGADDLDLGAAAEGARHDIEWVAIAEPNADPERLEMLVAGLPPIFGSGKSGPYSQGEAQGAAAFRRPEGCWYDAGFVYFTDTTGGAAQAGAFWALDLDAGVLRCVFASPGELHADHLDNLCFSPRGGILICEDGGGIRTQAGLESGNRLIGLHGSAAYPFAENNLRIDAAVPGRPWIAAGDYREREFAGACFSPRGDFLFVNVQVPGVTLAIWGRGSAARFERSVDRFGVAALGCRARRSERRRASLDGVLFAGYHRARRRARAHRLDQSARAHAAQDNDAGGSEKLWRMESSSISTLDRRGVTRELFNVGDRVKVAGHVSTRDASGFQLTNMLLPDGREASLWLDSPPRFGTAAMILRSDNVVDAAQRAAASFACGACPA